MAPLAFVPPSTAKPRRPCIASLSLKGLSPDGPPPFQYAPLFLSSCPPDPPRRTGVWQCV
ncbi:hypothetical protein K456DRAFT_46873 [Colletotrichum gloeosporioides 23]|nr:hypothetical protein K456DRAFT_46873 [Colletotrichum gloeosporioides 23]